MRKLHGSHRSQKSALWLFLVFVVAFCLLTPLAYVAHWSSLTTNPQLDSSSYGAGVLEAQNGGTGIQRSPQELNKLYRDEVEKKAKKAGKRRRTAESVLQQVEVGDGGLDDVRESGGEVHSLGDGVRDTSGIDKGDSQLPGETDGWGHDRSSLKSGRKEFGLEVEGKELLAGEHSQAKRLQQVSDEEVQPLDAVEDQLATWQEEGGEGSDRLVNLLKEQVIMARAYTMLAQEGGDAQLARQLRARRRELQKTLGEATVYAKLNWAAPERTRPDYLRYKATHSFVVSQALKRPFLAVDADLHRAAPERMRAMGSLLAKARDSHYESTAMVKQLRTMVQAAETQAKTLKQQSAFLSQLAAKTVPKGLHCLSQRLTVHYSNLPQEKRWRQPDKSRLEDPSLFHYALFSDNVLAAAVVVNSTITNAIDPEHHVIHIVTDSLNKAAFQMWFTDNLPHPATIDIESVDEFKWLNSSYCPVLKQLESESMKEYYFKADGASTTTHLKYRNPKYLSMLNHLRFYLPEVYPKLDKILFLDDDIVVQRDLTRLWEEDLEGNVNGAVETCGASFHRFDKYLNFSNPKIADNFDPQSCGWAYGMNVFDLKAWKEKDITGIYHNWQSQNEDRTLWKLGTLPPGLMTFYGLTHSLEKSWHVLGLGYNPNVDEKEISRAAVIHWNGNMKPWLEIGISRFKPLWTRYVNFGSPYLQQCNIAE